MSDDDLSLYGITDEIKILDELLQDAGGEIDEKSEARDKKLNELFVRKADSLAGYIQRCEDMADNADKRIKELEAFKKTKRGRAEWLKNYAYLNLKKIGLSSFLGERYELKSRKPSQVLEILPAAEIPMEYISTETKIDKKGLKDALVKEGLKLQGVSLVDGKKTITIKLRG